MKIRSVIRTNKTLPKAFGFTLVEALMAAAILGFITLPITTALINSTRSTMFSRNAYKANLYAESMLIGFEKLLTEDTELRLPDNLEDYYELDTFDYLIRINDMQTGELTEFKTANYIASDSSVICINNTIDSIISDTYSSEMIEYTGDSVIEIGLETVMDIISSDSTTAKIINNSERDALVRLWGDQIPVEILSSKAAVAVGFYSERKHGVYLLYVEIWDKKSTSLAVRAKLVFI